MHMHAQVQEKLSHAMLNRPCTIGLQQAQVLYEEKLQSPTSVAEKTMFALAWKVQELEQLVSSFQKLTAETGSLMRKLQDTGYRPEQDNFQRQLKITKEKLTDAVRRLSKHQRTAATHVMVFMVSPESRNRQPYALPVQCLPIKGLKDSTVRDMVDKVIQTMVDRNMKVAGK